MSYKCPKCKNSINPIERKYSKVYERRTEAGIAFSRGKRYTVWYIEYTCPKCNYKETVKS